MRVRRSACCHRLDTRCSPQTGQRRSSSIFSCKLPCSACSSASHWARSGSALGATNNLSNSSGIVHCTIAVRPWSALAPTASWRVAESSKSWPEVKVHRAPWTAAWQMADRKSKAIPKSPQQLRARSPAPEQPRAWESRRAPLEPLNTSRKYKHQASRIGRNEHFCCLYC